ncbi:xanthine dehydrogenase family protein molybdopterin-binding subunit, partial [Elusimicrobiota bacterium]
MDELKPEKLIKENEKIRVDAYGKVTSKTRFIGDCSRNDLLHGAVARSSVAHGRIISIKNIEDIKAMPGVRAVVMASDIPGDNVVPFVKQDYPCLAETEVKFIGQPIALVAADTDLLAKDAADAFEIEYEEYPAVFDFIQALRPDSEYVGGDDNIHSSYKIRKGDVERGFAGSDVIVEAVFTTKHQVHCYLENQGVIAEHARSGGLDLFGSMQ